MSRENIPFPERLRSARESRGLSQAQLAEKAGLQSAAIAHFEAGRRSPSLKNLRALAEALAVSSDYLIGLEKQQTTIDVMPSRLAKQICRLTAENVDLLELIGQELLKRQR